MNKKQKGKYFLGLGDPTAFSGIPIDEVKGYWDARPCNIRHSTQPVGTKEYFDEVEARKYFVEPHIPGFADFETWRDKKVLEIGCGIGTDTINFARAGAKVTAVDLSQKSIQVAEQRAEVFGLKDRIAFFQADAEHLSEVISQDKYDLIYSFGVIHHSPNPDQILKQTYRSLKPGGTLKIMIYHRWSWKVLWVLLTYGKGCFFDLDRIVATYSEAQTGCPVTYCYSRSGGRKFLEEAGFNVIEETVEHIFPYKISDYVEYRYVIAWQFRWIPKKLFRMLEKLIGWHLCLTAKKG